jgi:hypothetical protein
VSETEICPFFCFDLPILHHTPAVMKDKFSEMDGVLGVCLCASSALRPVEVDSILCCDYCDRIPMKGLLRSQGL